MAPSIDTLRVAFVFAMELEAQPLVEALSLQRDHSFGDPKLPMRHYRGSFQSRLELLVSVNGKCSRFGVDHIGTDASVLNAYVSIRQFRPDLLINAGTAGGFQKRGARIGDVYLGSDAYRFHDRRIPLGGYEQYGVGSFAALELEGMAEALGLKRGAITTGNSFDFTDRDLEMMERNAGVVKEMEAASIAWVAEQLRVPFLALKSITDLVDGERSSEEDFLANLELASRNLRDKTLGVLGYVVERPGLFQS